MKKKELTIDNIVYYLNSLDYTLNEINNIGFSLYNSIFGDFIDYFYGDSIEKSIPFNPYDSINKMKIHLPPEHCGVINRGVSKLSFKNLYPHIIKKLYELDKIEFNYTEGGEIYIFLVNNMAQIKEHGALNAISRKILNIIINALYGKSYYIKNSTNKYGVRISEPGQVVNYMNKIHSKLNKLDCVIYIDCDVVYFKTSETTNVISSIIDFDLPYDIADGYKIYLFENRPKTHITEYNGDIEEHGIFRHDNDIIKNEIINQLIIEQRSDKIDYLKDKMNNY